MELHYLWWMSRISCALVIPTYNEEHCIFNVVKEWHGVLNKVVGEHSFRILVVNDGSKDRTSEVLKQAANEFPNLLIINQQNGGHGKAIQRGYYGAIELETEWIFQVDSDDQFDPSDFESLWKLRNQSLFILGQRTNRDDALHRLILTKLVRLYILLLSFKLIPDANIPFRLIKASYLKFLLNFVPKDCLTPNIFLSSLAAADGVNLMNVGVTHRKRKTGVVSILGWKLVRFCARAAKQTLHLPNLIGQLRQQSNLYLPGNNPVATPQIP